MQRVELTPLLAAASAGFAAWISFASLAVATNGTESRFGFLPPLWLAPVLVVAFGIAARKLNLSRSRALPLFFSLVLLLPWIPTSVPAAFLLWTGPMVAVVWLAVVAGMVIVRTEKGVGRSLPTLSSRHSTRPAALALVAYLAGGWWLSPILPAGDEPHYLVIAESLLSDGDIRIENNYAEERYREYYGDTMRPHYIKRGQNGEIYSIHAPGLPAVIAPAFALFGYPGVVVWLALIAAAGSALLWRASYLCTRDVPAAWFAWAAGALSAPMFFEAFSVFPDGLGATVVLFAAQPLFEERLGRARWIATGAALALLPWLHTRLAIVSATLGVVLLLRLVGSAEGRSKIVPFLMVPAGSAIAWFSFFRIVYGEFDPSAPYGKDTQTSVMNILNGFPALLFDQQFGILPNAPVYGFCFVGLVVLARRRTRLAIELLAVALPYMLAVSAFHMWWGGTAAPARFLAPILPLMAVPAAWLWSRTPHTSTRAVGIALLFMSLVATAVLAGAEHGVLAYNVRDGYARAADWINPVVDLSIGMPSFFRHASGGLMVRAAIWIGFFAVAAAGLRMLEWRGGTRAMFALATPVVLAFAIMGALSVVWALDGVAAPNPERSQLNLVGSYGSQWRPHGVTLQPLMPDTAQAILEKITLASPTHREPLPDGTLLLLPEIVPAGAYVLRLTNQTHRSGEARLVIGRLARPSRTWDLTSDFRDGPPTLQLPVDVGSLIIAGDRGAPVGALALGPVRIWEGPSRLTNDIARRVERQGPALVFFFDQNVFPEEQGFWVRGGRGAQVAVAPADTGRPLQMFVRNAAVANQVRVEIDGIEQVLDLQPREERLWPLQIADHRPGALIRIHAQTGFNPSEVEPGSKDTRFLGVWVEFR